MSLPEKRRRLTGWLHGEGIEIGALHNPLAVPEGAHVTYVDHLPEERLREHYADLGDVPLVHVDVLGSAEDLSAFGADSVDFVIANHLLEHLERPIRGLREFARVLRPGGVLYLALPDKRQTFDRDRDLTTAEHLFEEDREGPEPNRWAHYLDWAVNVDKRTGTTAEAHARALLDQGYSIHFHVWRPDTFLDFFLEVRRREALPLQLVAFAAPEAELDDEFILVCVKGGPDSVWLPPPPEAPPPPPPPPPTLRQRLAATPAGPPVRAVKRTLRRLV